MSTYKFHKLQTAFVFLEAYPREVVLFLIIVMFDNRSSILQILNSIVFKMGSNLLVESRDKAALHPAEIPNVLENE